VRYLGVLVIPLCLRVVYFYCMLCKVRCLGLLVIPCNKYRPPSEKGESLEHLNTSLYRAFNKHRPPSDKGESLEHLNTSLPLCLRVVYFYCMLCKVRCLGLLVIHLCLRVVYIYCILCKVRCLCVLVIPLCLRVESIQ
jgi:hypothetical protein